MPTVFITGSGKRIGKGLAIEFARKGWNVAIHYNRSAEEAADTYRRVIDIGVQSVLVQADFRDNSQLQSAFEAGVAELGVPDVLVNNAGIFPQAARLENITDGLWGDAMDINLKSQYRLAKLFAAIAGDNARIINIGSLGGQEIWKHRLPYNVSKAGVIQLTKALAVELAPVISVNCVCPGAIEIPGKPPPEPISFGPGRIPMKRFGTVIDLFDAVYFFATASNYITGQVLNVDGGLHEARQQG